LAGLRKRMLRNQGMGNPAPQTNNPLDGQKIRSVVLNVASVAVETSAAATRTHQFPSDLLESSCPSPRVSR
jgi:hypothetical protein